MGYVLDMLAWPFRFGANIVIARLEEMEAEILGLWASWGDA